MVSGYRRVGLYGPGDKEQSVIDLLKAYGIERHMVSVYSHVHDTGYPGLFIPYTYVDLSIEDGEVLDEILSVLSKSGFESRI